MSKSTLSSLLIKDPSTLRLSPSEFQCGEVLEEGDVGAVTWYCTLPTTTTTTTTTTSTLLRFSCRGRSMNALQPNEEVVKDEDLEDVLPQVDPWMFDPGYTLAGRTGFQVWAGTRLLLECLLPWSSSSLSNNNNNDNNTTSSKKLAQWQSRLVQGAHVLELGSGVGVVGTCLAAVGAHVLLTDLPTLVENATQPNLEKIAKDTEEETALSLSCCDPPSWLKGTNTTTEEPTTTTVQKILSGWASAVPLDWTKPTNQQLSIEQCESIDIIVASDCVWLVSMLNSLFDTVASIFDASSTSSTTTKSPTLLLSFQRRDNGQPKEEEGTATSTSMFTTVEGVVAAIQARNWNIECLAWRLVNTKNDNDDDPKEVFLFEITP